MAVRMRITQHVSVVISRGSASFCLSDEDTDSTMQKGHSELSRNADAMGWMFVDQWTWKYSTFVSLLFVCFVRYVPCNACSDMQRAYAAQTTVQHLSTACHASLKQKRVNGSPKLIRSASGTTLAAQESHSDRSASSWLQIYLFFTTRWLHFWIAFWFQIAGHRVG